MSGLRDLAESKRDHFMFDPRLLKIDPQYNARNLETPEALDSINELALSIEESGLRVPLMIRLKDAEPYIVQGHRRLTAIHLLIARGVPIKTVECITEHKDRNDEERTLDLLLSNDGEPLTESEKAEVTRRLITVCGWNQTQIAKRMGKSRAYVSYLANVAKLPADIQDMVRDGEVSAHAALEVTRQEGAEAAKEILTEARDDAKADAVAAAPLAPAPTRVTPKRIADILDKRKGARGERNSQAERGAKTGKQNMSRLYDALFTQINKFLAKCMDGTYEDEDNEVPQRLHDDAKDLGESIKLTRSGFQEQEREDEAA